MKISVQKNRKSVLVLDWGRAPFGVERTKRGSAFIPHGYKVETFADKETWIGMTRVLDGAAEYCFSLKRDPQRATSDWLRTPTAAYGQANTRMKNLRYRPGTNAALILGCSYQNIQEEIQRRFGDELPLQTESQNKRARQGDYEKELMSNEPKEDYEEAAAACFPASPSLPLPIEANLHNMDDLEDDDLFALFDFAANAGDILECIINCK